MLPGIRFIFVTIILSVSVLIFGLGAAALLHAAHEEFASLPSWRAAQPQFPPAPAETNMPTLAMLRAEAPDATRDVPDLTPSASGTKLKVEDGVGDRNVAAESPPQATTSIPSADTVASVSIQANPQTEAEAPAPAPDMTATAPAPDTENHESGTMVGAPSDSRESEATPAESETEETEAAEVKTAEAKSDEAAVDEIKTPETAEPGTTNLRTHVLKTVEVKSQDARSQVAKAKVIKPSKPVIKKTNRPGIYAVQRRRAAARARAIARARAARIAAQQQLVQPDPLSVLFGVPAQPAQITHNIPHQ